MNELRTNPECIGTSIGMLRRAGYLLGFIVQYETCRKPFLKYMNNLINLTISHYVSFIMIKHDINKSFRWIQELQFKLLQSLIWHN